MNRTFHKSKNFKEAEEWDILQHIRMTPEQRQNAAAKLQKKVYGINVPDVRQVHKKK